MFLCLGGFAAGAQGFDWQYSARVPFQSPLQFFGVDLSSGYGTQFASLDYLESGTGFTCCTYDNGYGIPYGVLIAGDYWATPEVSIQGGLGLTVMNVSFTSAPQSYPRIENDVVHLVTSEYVFKSSITYATLQGAVRYRLLGTHLNVGGGLRALIKLSESQTQLDRVLGPDDYFFKGNPPSKEYDLNARKLDDASAFVLEPYGLLGYDLSLWRGTYVTPTLTIGGPVFSLSKTQPWRSIDIGLSVRIMTAL